MKYSVAQSVFTIIAEQSKGDADASLLFDGLISAAVRYARLRTDWQLEDLEGRIRMDAKRTSAHNSFISSCDALSRYLGKQGHDVSWRDDLTDDRKEIGDFACYIHAILGIAAR